MLEVLKLRNFKTWETADIEFGKITGFFGPSSSGKTTLIQFLLLLKQTKQATDRATSVDLNGAFTSLGVYGDMIHAHDEPERQADRCLGKGVVGSCLKRCRCQRASGSNHPPRVRCRKVQLRAHTKRGRGQRRALATNFSGKF